MRWLVLFYLLLFVGGCSGSGGSPKSENQGQADLPLQEPMAENEADVLAAGTDRDDVTNGAPDAKAERAQISLSEVRDFASRRVLDLLAEYEPTLEGTPSATVIEPNEEWIVRGRMTTVGTINGVLSADVSRGEDDELVLGRTLLNGVELYADGKVQSLRAHDTPGPTADIGAWLEAGKPPLTVSRLFLFEILRSGDVFGSSVGLWFGFSFGLSFGATSQKKKN